MATRLAAIALILTGLGAGALLAQRSADYPSQAVEWMANPRPLPAFQLAGSESYFDHHHLLGGWHLLILGYSHCPDVCPTTLTEAADLVKALGGNTLQVVFISVDNRRDTPAALADYATFFDPSFLGVTADDAQLKALATALGLRFQRTDDAITHSPTLSLIGPRGQLRGRLRPGYDRDRALAQLRSAMGQRS